MKIIEKIEIKHFRSFDGGVNQEKVQIDHIEDLNIFSGANDSGKSNVLRAINLFFNGEVSPGIKFDIERDFSKIVDNRFANELSQKKEKAKLRLEKAEEEGEEIIESYKKRSDTQVTIKVHFYNPKKQRGLPNKFWISKLFSSRNNFEGEYIYQGDLNKAQTTLFINSFQFEYVPAIKDRNYFNYLFEKLQVHLFEKEDKKGQNKFKKSSEELSNTLQSETKILFQNFLDTSGVHASFSIPTTLIDFFRTLSIKTENGVSLFERGDGVQARFIPDILEEITSNPKKNIIWGFEEPENSYESKNIRKLRDDFINKYSRDKQIFITTHTVEFLSIEKKYTNDELKILNNRKLSSTKRKDLLLNLSLDKSSSYISIYRVWKKGDISFITRFNEDKKTWEEINEDLGIIDEPGIIDESRLIDKLHEQIAIQNKLLNESGLDKERQVQIGRELYNEREKCIRKLSTAEEKIEEYEKPILYIEDKYYQIYKITYLKSNNINCNEDNFEELFKEKAKFIIHTKESSKELNKFLDLVNIDDFEGKKILGLFDFDSAYSEFNGLNSLRWGIIEGTEKTGLYRIRNNNFKAMLLPVPDHRENYASKIFGNKSSLEIELLFTDEILLSLGCSKNEIIPLTSQRILKFSGKKSTFWKKLFSLSNQEFKFFKLLFDEIEKKF